MALRTGQFALPNFGTLTEFGKTALFYRKAPYNTAARGMGAKTVEDTSPVLPILKTFFYKKVAKTGRISIIAKPAAPVVSARPKGSYTWSL